MDAVDKGGHWWIWIRLLTLPPMKHHAPNQGNTLLMKLPWLPPKLGQTAKKSCGCWKGGLCQAWLNPISITIHKVHGETTMGKVSSGLQDGTAYEHGS